MSRNGTLNLARMIETGAAPGWCTVSLELAYELGNGIRELIREAEMLEDEVVDQAAEIDRLSDEVRILTNLIVNVNA